MKLVVNHTHTHTHTHAHTRTHTHLDVVDGVYVLDAVLHDAAQRFQALVRTHGRHGIALHVTHTANNVARTHTHTHTK